MYSTSLWRVGAIFCWGQRCWVFLYIGWNHHNSRLGGHSGWCYGRFLCFAATFSRETTNSARKYRQNCIVKENIVILQQQIPPRFPFEQRTRAELRFYRDMDYTKNALDYTQISTQLKARGLLFKDEERAVEVLANISYFRIANYLRYFEIDNDRHL